MDYKKLCFQGIAQNAFDQFNCRIRKNLISTYENPEIPTDMKMF